MEKISYLKILSDAGLTPGEIAVYEGLLSLGEATAGQIIAQSGLKRGDCYNKLYELVAKGLVEENKRFKVLRFRLAHPNKLESYVNSINERTFSAKQQLAAVLPQILSKYNLHNNQPGVKVFEGESGLEAVAGDSLLASGEILSYVDAEAIERNLAAFNKRYVKRREQLGKTKRILVTDSAYNREYFKKIGPNVTDVRFLEQPMEGFKTNMQIYDDKVSYFVIKPSQYLGVIIQDENISRLHRSLFEYTWASAKLELN